MKSQSKADLAASLEKAKERYLGIWGGEVTRYASPEEPPKIKTGVSRKIHNLKEECYRQFLRDVEEGKYHPDTNFQQRPPSRREVRLDDFDML